MSMLEGKPVCDYALIADSSQFSGSVDIREQCTSEPNLCLTEMEVIVNVQEGDLRGKVVDNLDGGQYVAFRGIPYAKPPTGTLRFKDPEPAEKWNGIRDALQFGPKCAQIDVITKEIVGTDDCLYLNVYTTNVEPEHMLPVMVWIHGGGFRFGSANDDLYGPDYLVKKGVVLVTINYRLGVLGFLNLEHEVATGNQGLKDQVMALRWVQDNISNFGGNPRNVTIFGESAGSASVHYLALSPLADGLFHKAIGQSGVATNPWAFATQDQWRYGFRIAAILGFESFDPEKIVEFLQKVDTKKLIEAQKKLTNKKDGAKFILAFNPSVDYMSPQPFMPQHPSIVMQRGVHVPYLIGHNSNEGIFFLTEIYDGFYDDANDNIENAIHPHIIARMRREKISPAYIKRLYFGDGPITKEKSRPGHANLLADILFVQDVYDVVNTQMEKSQTPTYLYKFSYDCPNSLLKALFSITEKGAMHGDDLFLLFYPHMLAQLGQKGPERGTPEYKLIQRFTQMWTDFAKTGNPTPAKTSLIPETWNPVKPGDYYDHLEINDNLKMITTKKGTERSEWPSMRNKL